MNRKKWLALIAGALVLIVGAGGVVLYFGWQASEAARIARGGSRLGAAAAGFPEVERASLDACLCRRKNGPDAGCDAIYTDARNAMLKRAYGDTPPPPPNEEFSMCAPIATEVECFDFADGYRCFTARYDVVAAGKDAPLDEVCTADEARAVEQAQQAAWLGPEGKPPASGDRAALDAANRRTGAAINDVLRRLKAGERVSAPASSGGCAG